MGCQIEPDSTTCKASALLKAGLSFLPWEMFSCSACRTPILAEMRVRTASACLLGEVLREVRGIKLSKGRGESPDDEDTKQYIILQ